MLFRKRLLSLAVLLFAATPIVLGQGKGLEGVAHRSIAPQASGSSFAPAVAYGSGGNGTSSVAVADVNGDGIPDLLVANGSACSNCTNGAVGVLLGNGDGTFQTAVAYDSGGQATSSVAVADVNGDGNPDLLVANGYECSSCTNGSVAVLLGNGNGTFQMAMAYASGGPYASSVAVSDVNGDGKPDLLVANNCLTGGCQSSFTVGVLLGNGDGTFKSAVAYASGALYAHSVAVADVNGDGRPDLLVANGYQCSRCTNGAVGVLLGNGDGTFQTAVAYASGGDQAVFVAAADVNGDGRPDLLVANAYACASNCTKGSIAVLLGNGDGTFQTAVTYASSGYATDSVAVADVNGDGNPDLLVANAYACASNCMNSTVDSLLGNGDGTFQTAEAYDSGGYQAVSVAVADVNGDGRPDLLVANSCASYSNCPTGAVGVLINILQPTVTLSPTSLAFATQAVFTTSVAQPVTLTNTGTGTLTITNIGVSGQFAETNTCGTSVVPGGSCTISAAFRPRTKGTLTGSISITDNASGSPQKVSLTGTGTYIQLEPTSANFGGQPVGTTSLPKKVTVSNKGNVTVTISGISITGANAGDFAIGNNTCGTSLASGASCFVMVTFTPLVRGKRTANLSISDNGGGSPQEVTLMGNGT